MLFASELSKIDPGFIIRMRESALWEDDKSVDCKYSLFNDKRYSDVDYHKAYPTVYHLRQELLSSKEPHDVRLVYLALHHIMKSRGHFLYEQSDGAGEDLSVDRALDELSEFLEAEYGLSFAPECRKEFIMQRNDGRRQRKNC